MRATEREGSGEGRRLPGRLKGVRKRRRALRALDCEVMAQKMRLVRVRDRRDGQS
jgi:hypothetical protein